MIALDAKEFRPNNPAALPPRIFSTAPGGKGNAATGSILRLMSIIPSK
jgi:hypothetical protein